MYTIKWQYDGHKGSQRYASSGGAERKAIFLRGIGAVSIVIVAPDGTKTHMPSGKEVNAETLCNELKKDVDKRKRVLSIEEAWAFKLSQHKQKGKGF